MNPSDLLTVDTILMSVLIAQFTALSWIGKRYIAKDDAWKKHVDLKLNELAAIRTVCMQDFASKESVDKIWDEVGKNQKDIAELKGVVKATIQRSQ